MNMVQDMQDEGYFPYGPTSETVEDAQEILIDVKANTPDIEATLAKDEDGTYLVMIKESHRMRNVVERMTQKYLTKR